MPRTNNAVPSSDGLPFNSRIPSWSLLPRNIHLDLGFLKRKSKERILVKVIYWGSTLRKRGRKETGEGKERKLSKDVCLTENGKSLVPQEALDVRPKFTFAVCVYLGGGSRGTGKENILYSYVSKSLTAFCLGGGMSWVKQLLFSKEGDSSELLVINTLHSWGMSTSLFLQ